MAMVKSSVSKEGLLLKDAQGFLQRHGVDNEEILSPVTYLSSILTLFAFTAERKL